MFEHLQKQKDDPKEPISARISTKTKRNLEIEAQRWGVTVSDIIIELVEGRELYFGMSQFDGVLLDISEANQVHLQSFCVKNNLNPTEYILNLVNTHIAELANNNQYTYTSLFQNPVNTTQGNGLQALTNENRLVDTLENGRISEKTAKMAFFENREKRLNEVINSVKTEMRFPTLLNNAINLIKFAFENSGVMKKQLQKSTMYGILLDGFTEEEVQVLLDK